MTTPQCDMEDCAQQLAFERRTVAVMSQANEQLCSDNYAINGLFLDARKEAQGLHNFVARLYDALNPTPTTPCFFDGADVRDFLSQEYRCLALQHGSERQKAINRQSGQHHGIDSDMFAPLLRRMPPPGLRQHYAGLQQQMHSQRGLMTKPAPLNLDGWQLNPKLQQQLLQQQQLQMQLQQQQQQQQQLQMQQQQQKQMIQSWQLPRQVSIAPKVTVVTSRAPPVPLKPMTLLVEDDDDDTV